MVWLDYIIKDIETRFAKQIAAGKPLIIRDEKTLSGRVHVGSLRGIVLHGLIAQALEEKKIAHTFLFELNDFDPCDELPPFLDRAEYEKYLGQPLFTVPSHDASAENFPMVFGNELKEVVDRLKLPIEYYTLKPLYEAGKFNEVIQLALDHAKEIREIYKVVSGSNKPDDWYPLQVICEKCGKVGTTQVTSWNGKMVTYNCKPNLVKWAKGCGNQGSVSPFDGRAKLPWKVEWPAKWKVMNVNIEGAGKDHSAAGGSRQIGERIAEEIFKYPNPFDIPYEFLNVGGKKMRASKGIGVSAKEIADLMPPYLSKLLMIRKQPNQPFDFDPQGTTLPLLFDEYDRLSDLAANPKPEQLDFARMFQLAQLEFPKPAKPLWQMRFTILSFVIQMPHLKLENEAANLKGSPLSKEELSALKERATYVKLWLDEHAPEQYHYGILKDPPEDLALDEDQKKALSLLRDRLEKLKSWKGEDIHAEIHAVKTETGLEAKKIFAPLYLSFIGRESGPQMGWFLSTFDRKEVVQRLENIVLL